MSDVEGFSIRFCECGRIHIEGRHFRLSFQPAEFLALLRSRAQIGALPTIIDLKKEDVNKTANSADDAPPYFTIPGERFHGASHTD